MNVINIENRKIGEGQPVFIIAEVSANHGQDFGRAIELIKKAKECGADAVKFQTYTPDTMTLNSDNKLFKVNHPEWGGQTLYELYEKAYTPWEWFKDLKKAADDCGLLFFSTAYDKSSVDFLEELGVTVHKVASFELVDLPLIRYMARTGTPIIVSTGMSTLPEINDAVRAVKKAGGKEMALLKCVSSYPALPEEMNLKTIPDMKKRFKCPIGLSDHTLGTGVSVASICLGAKIIEKHFTLSRELKGPDSFFSIEPGELRELVKNIRVVEQSLGKVHYGLTKKEEQSRVFRRSLFVVKDIKKGEVFTEENVRSIRPAGGIVPKYLGKILGAVSRADIKKGTPIDWQMIDKKPKRR
ncbi:pseudaminic acid synthase [Elusimicrobiota bacterium]